MYERVAASCRQRLPVRRKPNGEDHSELAPDGFEFFAGGGVPQAEAAVVSSGGDGFAVR